MDTEVTENPFYDVNNMTGVYEVLFAVSSSGLPYLVKSNPGHLEDIDVFDTSNMEDVVGMPEEPGIYTGTLTARTLKTWTDDGYEYECETDIANVVKLNLDLTTKI